MNEFLLHIPNFVSVATEPTPQKFGTTEDLLNIDAVKRMGKIKNFSHFALYKQFLMAVMKGGFEWLVVGYIKDPSSVALPKWDGGHRKQQRK